MMLFLSPLAIPRFLGHQPLLAVGDWIELTDLFSRLIAILRVSHVRIRKQGIMQHWTLITPPLYKLCLVLSP